MKPLEHYDGQRLSLNGQLCTVRYVGSVADKPGTWLGVEWDDPQRGKHNGTHENHVYFTCRNSSATAASFLRPTQPWDESRTFLQALREKYMPEFHEGEAEVVYISGKQAEEIGFEKFSQRQSKLQGIHVLVLDHMRMRHLDESEVTTISEVCADITELDLSGNLFETFDEIVRLCRCVPKLRVLALDGNRFKVDAGTDYGRLLTVQTLSLSRMLLQTFEMNAILAAFPSLKHLTIAENELSDTTGIFVPQTVSTLDLSGNHITAMDVLRGLAERCPQTLVLKRNQISSISASSHPELALPVVELDLSYNAIDSWTFFNDMTGTTFPDLKHLRITGNPLYKDLHSADGKALTKDDGYMLTIARIPQLETLNYAKITDKERLNAETYYLCQIAIEISNASEGQEAELISRHPRYRGLCDEYGEPTIQRKPKHDEIDPNSLAARLVTITFTLAPRVLPHIKPRSWLEEIPKSFTVYAVLGIVGKRLDIMPLDVRLILETNERDPVGRDIGYSGPEWWNSSDEESDGINGTDGEWVKREVELIAGTRTIGTYIEGREAILRVEMRDSEP